jgi:hypothetical protein
LVKLQNRSPRVGVADSDNLFCPELGKSWNRSCGWRLSYSKDMPRQPDIGITLFLSQR